MSKFRNLIYYGISRFFNLFPNNISGVPILLYHRVGTEEDCRLSPIACISIDNFELQLDYLIKQGYIHPTLRFDFDNILSAAVKVVTLLEHVMLKTVSAIGLQKKKMPHGTVIPVGGLGIANRIKRWFLLPDSQFLWVVLAMPKALWIARRCEVIYSSSSPVSSHVLGLIVHKITQKPWVADYRDEWT